MNRTKTVGAYEAKTTLWALLTLVEGGGEVIITKHERPVARLVPFDRRSPKADVFTRLRALRGRLILPPGETARDLISAGRRV
jgi:prevent-host-death family protein